MKNYLIKPTKFTIILLIFLLSYSCETYIIHDIEMEGGFDQLQVLRDGAKVDTTAIDSNAIILDTIISTEEKKCEE